MTWFGKTWHDGTVRLRRVHRLTLTVACLAIVALTAPSTSAAFENRWSCPSLTSAVQCQDSDPSHHSWIAVQIKIDYYLNPDKICAYAWTAAGNQRTGSGCDPNDWIRTSCLSGSSPNSRGLGNWYWPGRTHNTAGYAATPSSNQIC